MPNFDANSLLYVVLIPIVLSIISNALYDYFKPRFIRTRAHISVSVAEVRLEELAERKKELTELKNDFELLGTIAFREILRAFWSIFITGSILMGYFTARYFILESPLQANLPQNIIDFANSGLYAMLLGLLLRHFSNTNRRVLYHYRLIRDVVDFDKNIKRINDEVKELEQNLKKMTKEKDD